MSAFYLPNGEPLSKEDFVSRYGMSYFLGGDRLVPRVRQNSKFVEDEIDRLLSEGIRNKTDVVHILAWKIGKVLHEASQNDGEFRYAKDWADAELSDVKVYGKPFELQRLADYVSTNIERLEREAIDDPQAVLDELNNLDIKGLGSVYLVTLLYFISQGEWPIFDRFAARAVYAISQDIVPGGTVEETSLPDHHSKKFKSIVNGEHSPYVEYRKDLEHIFGADCSKNRDVDRALWVYGHSFQVK